MTIARMPRGFARTGLVLATLACTALVAGAAGGAETLDGLSKKAVAATGGLAKLKSVNSQRMKGQVTFPQGVSAPITVELKRPNRIRIEISLPQGTLIQAFDGKMGWQQNPGSEPARVSDGQARDLSESADLDGPFVGSKEKGFTVRLLGTEKVEGKDAHKVSVKTADGAERLFFYDAKSFLKVKWRGTLSSSTEKKTFASRFSDYRDVGGLKRHFHVKSGPEGSEGGQEIAFETIELNPAIDDARFAMPKPPAPAPPAKPKS